jgi:hypothetical protein
MQRWNELALWIVRGSALYHFLMGVTSMLSVRWVTWISSKLYDLRIPKSLDPGVEYGLKPLGAFALILSIWCTQQGWFADRSGADLTLIKLSLALLFILRALFRVVYRDLFERASGVSWRRSRWNVGLNIILSGVLIASCW